jgi:hypothetical protein
MDAMIELPVQQPQRTVWDDMPAPETLEDLVLLIEDSKDCNMFHGMVGPPRAYFELPMEDGNMLRVRYTVVGFIIKGKPNSAEKRLCKHMWEVFVRVRKHMNLMFPNMQPVVFWRNVPELERHGVATRIYFRFAVPGCDLTRLFASDKGYHDHERDGYLEVLS